MADIQRQFEQFHDCIRVDYEISSQLREKRDIVVDKIRNHLKEHQRPGFRVLLQGSYKMKTGVKPLANLEYDIDIGIRFDMTPNDSDSGAVRGWVFDAVKGHTNRCEDRGPCVRVAYEAGFHLDLVTYATWDENSVDHYRLAHKTKGWCPADPPGLLALVDQAREAFKGTDDTATQTDQFRRVVRALRRWADVQNPAEDDQKPTGLAIVLLCTTYLQPAKFVDLRPDDRSAIERVARAAGGAVGRIVLKKPTPEYEDVLAGIKDGEMEKLKSRLTRLADALRAAGSDADPVEACERLVPFFGSDFPVPPPEDTGKKTLRPAIVTSSHSA